LIREGECGHAPLLLRLDRLPYNELQMTQELIANMLKAHRATAEARLDMPSASEPGD
jgi:hypothetical protein